MRMPVSFARLYRGFVPCSRAGKSPKLTCNGMHLASPRLDSNYSFKDADSRANFGIASWKGKVMLDT
jgi:hypothetical protein